MTIYNTQARFRVAVNNLMSLPRNPEVLATLRSAPNAQVALIQEADLPEFHKALNDVGPHRVTAKIPGGNVYSTFVMFDPDTWDHVSTQFVKAYDGAEGVSLTRHIAVTILRHKGVNQEVAFLSYHRVTAGKDRVRTRLRRAGDRVVRAQVKRLRALGLPVVLGCDQNGTGNLFPSRAIHVRDALMHLYVWHGRHLRFRKNGSHTIDTRSDHNTLVVGLTATVR